MWPYFVERVITDVSQRRNASIFRTQQSKRALKMKAVRCFEPPGTIRQATQGHIPNTWTFSTNSSFISRTEHRKEALMVSAGLCYGDICVVCGVFCVRPGGSKTCYSEAIGEWISASAWIWLFIRTIKQDVLLRTGRTI